MKHFAGIDLSMASAVICVLDEKGKVVRETAVAREPDVIAQWLGETSLEIELVGLEAGAGSSLLTLQLREAGLRAVCMDARALAGFLKAKFVNKNDRNDARGIAEALRLDAYRPVHPKSHASREIKALLSLRRQMVKSFSCHRLVVHGMLKEFGIVLGRVGKGAFVEKVRELLSELPELVATGVETMLQLIEVTAAQLKALERQVRDFARGNPGCCRLMTIPGVGPITSLTFLSEIDDIHRFEKSRSVGAYVGLTPRENSSGEVRRLGRISRAGSAELRSLLVEAGIVLLGRSRKWSKLKAWGMRIARRHGSKKAAVALGRKLSVVMHRMLVTEKDFSYGEPKRAA